MASGVTDRVWSLEELVERTSNSLSYIGDDDGARAYVETREGGLVVDSVAHFIRHICLFQCDRGDFRISILSYRSTGTGTPNCLAAKHPFRVFGWLSTFGILGNCRCANGTQKGIQWVSFDIGSPVTIKSNIKLGHYLFSVLVDMLARWAV
jgi:hypothetical protein